MQRLCFLVVSILLIIPGAKTYAANAQFSSYQDIPGVTGEMIDAIEALKQSRQSFTYGSLNTTETFMGEDGALQGFTPQFCAYLSALFGIPFVPTVYEWDELTGGLASFDIDFSGELTATDERRKTYYMTDAIAMHTINYFFLNDSKPLTDIAKERPLRLIFLNGEHSASVLGEVYSQPYESITVSRFSEGYTLLESGAADAFVSDDTAEVAISASGPVSTQEIYPLMYASVSMSTQNASLEPVIAVVQKLLEASDSTMLTDMYNDGRAAFQKHQFNQLLTQAEKDFIAAHGEGIPVAGAADDYPVSFHSRLNSGQPDEQWQGIAFDALEEISALSGLKFNIVDSAGKDLKQMLSAGEVEMIAGVAADDSGIIYADTPLFEDNYVLISREDMPDIMLNEIFNKRVGFLGGDKYENLFRLWFPAHRHVVTHETEDAALKALANGNIDLAMASRGGLLRVTHYLEQTGYKANFTFNYPFNVSFGFNPGEEVLCGIVNKAMSLGDIPAITARWADKNYDYQSLLFRSRFPLLIIGIVMALVMVMTMLALSYKSREGARLKEEVSLQTTRLLAVINGIPDMVFCKDTNHRYTLVNISLMQYFGLREDEIIDADSRVANLFADTQYEDMIAQEKALLQNREVIREEQRLPDGNGGYRFFEAVKVPIIQDSQVIGLLGIARDITKRKEAEQGVRAASESKTMFLANMSHEIRTPMNSIVGFSELALSDDIAPRTRDYLNKIIENAEWLLRIIDDILDISKIESGKMSIKNAPFDLRDVFLRCQTAIAPSASEKGLKLYCYAEPAIGRRLIGDPTRLRQVINNILSNAVKFTNKGTVKLSSAVRLVDDTHAAVTFEVKDSGIGIPPELITTIFDPFMQADSSTTRKQGGTGLGLTIAKNIIDLMGGKLMVESAVGVGSRFFFEIVFDTIEIDVTAKKQADADLNIARPNFDAHVLLCEDNAMNQLVITEHLKKVGITATVAENGRIGVDTVKARVKNGEKPFDLIFMDIHMPEMDGIEAASRITKLNTGTPIVALTANIMTNDLELYKENGMPDCVGKPFTSQELWKCLVKYLKAV